jgi:flavorubredoxin
MPQAALNSLHSHQTVENVPILLLQKGDHQIYWLGIQEETVFRCNIYLIIDGDRAILIDPGNRSLFPNVHNAARHLLGEDMSITDIVLCHQDPDVAASMVDWLGINPSTQIITSARTNVLLPHYGYDGYKFYDISENPIMRLPSGAALHFIEAPFLHFPGAFTTYDTTTQALFSGDIWAALDLDWELVVDDFDEHISKMDLFHLDYMACNLAARGFIRNLSGLKIENILPQHGSIIAGENVPLALDYLQNLQCGLDLIYADLQD